MGCKIKLTVDKSSLWAVNYVKLIFVNVACHIRQMLIYLGNLTCLIALKRKLQDYQQPICWELTHITFRNYPRIYTSEDGAPEKRYFKSQEENSKVRGNAFQIITNRFNCLTAQHQKTKTVNNIVEATVVLRLWHTVELPDVDRLIKLTKYETDESTCTFKNFRRSITYLS